MPPGVEVALMLFEKLTRSCFIQIALEPMHPIGYYLYKKRTLQDFQVAAINILIV